MKSPFSIQSKMFAKKQPDLKKGSPDGTMKFNKVCGQVIKNASKNNL